MQTENKEILFLLWMELFIKLPKKKKRKCLTKNSRQEMIEALKDFD
jgi:hypothetical protein